MKVGDLVQVGPAMGGMFIITSMQAHDHENRELPTCVMLGQLSGPPWMRIFPMDKKWIKVINESR